MNQCTPLFTKEAKAKSKNQNRGEKSKTQQQLRDDGEFHCAIVHNNVKDRGQFWLKFIVCNRAYMHVCMCAATSTDPKCSRMSDNDSNNKS